MGDLDAFERQLATVMQQGGRASLPVDVAAIVHSTVTSAPTGRWTVITRRLRGGTSPTPRERGFTMFSALKFIAAAVIVALFGGFLLAGVLTTPQGNDMAPAAVTESPAPTMTDELLSGMVTEEVEPGVLHILNDGVRDLAHLARESRRQDLVMVDGAGAVWYIVGDERYFRLGAEEEWPIGQGTDLRLMDIVDGRLVTGSDDLTDLLGPRSATPEVLGLDGGVSAIEVQADGTLWLLRDGGSLVRVSLGGIAEAFSWKDVHDGLVGGLAVTPDGDAWLMGRPEVGRYPAEVFLHFDGDDWEIVPVPAESPPDVLWAGPLASSEMFDVGPDGTLWTLWDYGEPHRSLARYDGPGWTIYGEADGVRPWGEPGWPFGDVVRVAPDGSAWVVAAGPARDRCGGLGRFDEESWASYLPDTCIDSYDIAPDGAVWVVGSGGDDGIRDGDHETYVITPEAVAASE